MLLTLLLALLAPSTYSHLTSYPSWPSMFTFKEEGLGVSDSCPAYDDLLARIPNHEPRLCLHPNHPQPLACFPS
jgi:hypothetical protein